MENPLISICIPTYNGQKFFETCLKSAIGQTYMNIEIIIVDDQSTDNTYEIAEQYAAKDSGIKLYRNETNLGLVGNWNKCIELSQGTWIKFLFQDDYFAPDCIEIMVNALSPEDRMVSSGRRLVLDESLDEATKEYSINETLMFERLGIVSKSPVFISAEKISLFATRHISMNFIGEPTVIMFKKDVVKEFGTFNPDLIQICDLEYFLRIGCNYGVKYLPQPLTYFRVHKGSASTSNIAERIFSMTDIDPIIMAHQLLFGAFFKHFRDTLSILQKVKLKLFFRVRVYESYRNALQSSPQNREKFETVKKKYPAIARYGKNTIMTSISLQILKLKRIFRNKS